MTNSTRRIVNAAFFLELLLCQLTVERTIFVGKPYEASLPNTSHHEEFLTRVISFDLIHANDHLETTKRGNKKRRDRLRKVQASKA